MKKAHYIFAIIAILIILFYAIPVKEKNFEAYYSGDQKTQEKLREFRAYPIKSITHQNKDWEYIAIGNGQKHLLFLHGMGGASDIWFQQIAKLKEDFHIISLTMPTVNSLEDATDGIIQILDEENIKQVNLIGTSMGGYIGQYFLNKYPTRLKKIVLGNTFPPNGFYRKQNGKMRKIVPYLPEWLVMKNFRKNAAANVVSASENSELVKAYLMEQYSGLMSKQQFMGRFDMVLEHFDMKNDAIKRSIPKLIIESNNDPLVNQNLRNQLKSNFREAAVFTFADKGHFPYLNQPTEYNKVLLDFLQN